MSLTERVTNNHGQNGNPVQRSHSFGGFKHEQNPFMSQRVSSFGSPVAGMNKRTEAKVFNFKSPSHRRPKVPRPNRVNEIFTSLKRGLSDLIESQRTELADLKAHKGDTDTLTRNNSCTGFFYDLDKQTKATERYIRRLEYHHTKVEELAEAYNLHQRLREGARNMVNAYNRSRHSQSFSRHSQESLSEVKSGFKECSQTMCIIEGELEQMLGSFQMRIKGMAGFARLCPGDVYDLLVRYGPQKWRLRGRVERDLTQVWDNQEVVFQPLIADMLNFKVSEVKTLGRSVVIGNMTCETKGFYNPVPQVLTINVNDPGTLKLQLIVKWSPCERETEDWFGSLTKKESTHIRKRYSTADSVLTSSSSSGGSYNSPDSSMSASYPRRLRPLFEPPAKVATKDTAPQEPTLEEMDTSPAPPPDTVTNGSLGALPTTTVTPTVHLEHALHCLSIALEDYRGQYHELQELEEELIQLQQRLKKTNVSRRSSGSSISLSVESALESFNFLNFVGEESDLDSEPDRGFTFSTFKPDWPPPPPTEPPPPPPTTNGQLDPSKVIQEKKSSAASLNEDIGLGASQNSSPVPLTTGIEAVDVALVHHLQYCQHLLGNLGSFGPLRCREMYSLDKLKKQAAILWQLRVLVEEDRQQCGIVEACPVLKDQPRLVDFWNCCCQGQETVLYTTMDKLHQQLEVDNVRRLRIQYTDVSDRVLPELIRRMTDDYNPREEGLLTEDQPHILSIYQFAAYVTTAEVGDIGSHVDLLAIELTTIHTLQSSNHEQAIKAVKKIGKSGVLPSKAILHTLGGLMLDTNPKLTSAASSCINTICTKSGGANREKHDHEENEQGEIEELAFVLYLECLEDKDPNIRSAGCAALGCMKARESMDSLLYLCQSDVDDVKRAARDALLALAYSSSLGDLTKIGEEGRLAFEHMGSLPGLPRVMSETGTPQVGASAYH
ncbi:rho family-interacting cell polarization regulator 2-like isoform X12 [Branchiostoma floridae x Branchiostoma belcheri]